MSAAEETVLGGRYRVLGSVGQGNFGVVLLVAEVASGRRWVMKKVDLREMKEKEREAARQEASVLSTLDHPCIVGYHESALEGDVLYIVMEYCGGGDLSRELTQAKTAQKPFSEQQILDWFVQIALALRHIHSSKILHRDLKTQNVFLTEDKLIKLGDFGISKVLSSDTEMAKTAIGTPFYLSPEICEGRKYGKKSDIWALGCILYELTTLRRAFSGRNLPALVLKILRGMYPPIPERYSAELRSLIASMLQQDALERPGIHQILKMPFLAKTIHKYEPSLDATLLLDDESDEEGAYEEWPTTDEEDYSFIDDHPHQHEDNSVAEDDDDDGGGGGNDATQTQSSSGDFVVQRANSGDEQKKDELYKRRDSKGRHMTAWFGELEKESEQLLAELDRVKPKSRKGAKQRRKSPASAKSAASSSSSAKKRTPAPRRTKPHSMNTIKRNNRIRQAMMADDDDDDDRLYSTPSDKRRGGSNSKANNSKRSRSSNSAAARKRAVGGGSKARGRRTPPLSAPASAAARRRKQQQYSRPAPKSTSSAASRRSASRRDRDSRGYPKSLNAPMPNRNQKNKVVAGHSEEEKRLALEKKQMRAAKREQERAQQKARMAEHRARIKAAKARGRANNLRKRMMAAKQQQQQQQQQQSDGGVEFVILASPVKKKPGDAADADADADAVADADPDGLAKTLVRPAAGGAVQAPDGADDEQQQQQMKKNIRVKPGGVALDVDFGPPSKASKKRKKKVKKQEEESPKPVVQSSSLEDFLSQRRQAMKEKKKAAANDGDDDFQVQLVLSPQQRQQEQQQPQPEDVDGDEEHGREELDDDELYDSDDEAAVNAYYDAQISRRNKELSEECENLRSRCEQLLGDELFRKVYTSLRHDEDDEADEVVDRELANVPKRVRIEALGHLHRLLYVEDQVF